VDWRVRLALIPPLVLAALLIAAPQLILVIEYGESRCPACASQKEILEGLQKGGKLSYVYVDLAGSEENAREFVEIYDLLGLREVTGGYYVPLLLVVVDGRVRGVAAAGVYTADQLLSFAQRAADAANLLTMVGPSVLEVRDERAAARLQSIVEARLRGAGVQPGYRPLSASEALALLVPLAAADSVNPCTFAVYTALLMLVLVLGGPRRMLASALAFIAAVFACYYLLGVGLVTVASAMPPALLKAVAAAGLMLAAYSIAASLKGFRSPVPERLKRVTEGALNRVAGPAGAAGLGALCSFTLLPCSSGPYLVFAGILSRVQQWAIRYALLAVYNLIFVAPLAALAAAVLILGIKAKTLKKLRTESALALMEIVASALLATVCAWLLLAY